MLHEALHAAPAGEHLERGEHRRVEILTAEGRMRPAGLQAFPARQEKRSRIYTYEQPGRRERLAARPLEFGEPYAGLLKENAAAWEYFHARPPSCRKKGANGCSARRPRRRAGGGWSA